MDYTQIIIGILGVITTIFVGIIAKQLVPWLKQRNLFDAAIVAVHAAEALYGRYNGKEKLKKALESLKEKGFDVNSSVVMDAVQAAWKQLDQAMYASGEKYIQEDQEEEKEET